MIAWFRRLLAVLSRRRITPTSTFPPPEHVFTDAIIRRWEAEFAAKGIKPSGGRRTHR